jgi:hypothetical protein
VAHRVRRRDRRHHDGEHGEQDEEEGDPAHP